MNLTVSPTALQPRGEPVHFSGRKKTFLGLAIKGSLLQIPTVGFYRFWLITNIRRHLWANTRMGDDAFEYVGTGKELLIGFLIATAILMPLYIGYFTVAFMITSLQPLASVVLLPIVWVLARFAGYRARRYRVSRTTFRGLRFWMTGIGWSYTLRAVAWDVATLLTLGLAMPWAMASLERYRMRHTYFGTLQGDFTGTGWALFKRGSWIWLAFMGLIVSAGAVVYAVAGKSEYEVTLTVGGIVVMLTVSPLLAIAGSIVTRWRFEHLRMGEASVSSNLGRGAFLGPFLRLFGATFLFSLLFSIATYVVVSFGSWLAQGPLELIRTTDPDLMKLGSFVLAAPGYLLWLLGLGVLSRYFVERGLWVVTANSLSISNPAALDRALAAGDASGVLGEGFAAALDFELGM